MSDCLLLWLSGFSIQILRSMYIQFVLLLLGKGLGLRWRLSPEIKHLLLTKHLTMLSAQAAKQKPYKLHAIARKRDLQKYTNRQYQTLGHTVLYITLKSLDSKIFLSFSLKSLLKCFSPIMLFETPLFKEVGYIG